MPTSDVVTAFCFDDRLLHGRHASGPRTQFLLECLADLDRELRERGGGLVIRRGPPERELAGLAGETGATVIHATQDVSPFARRRGERVRAALGDSGIELRSARGAERGRRALDRDRRRASRTRSSRPFTASGCEAPRRQVLEAPRELPPLPSRLAKGRIPSLASLGLAQEVGDPARGGESEARRALDRFLDGRVHEYTETHDALGA